MPRNVLTCPSALRARTGVALALVLTVAAGCGGASGAGPGRDADVLPDRLPAPESLPHLNVLVCHGSMEGDTCPTVPIPLEWLPEDDAGWEHLGGRCEGGDDRACWVHAFLRAAPWFRPSTLELDLENWEENTAAIERACASGENLACVAAGALLEAGLGRPDRRPIEAVGLYEDACERGYTPACANLGAWMRRYSPALENMSFGGPPRWEGGDTTTKMLRASVDLLEGRQTEAILLFDEACGQGDRLGCVIAALHAVLVTPEGQVTDASLWIDLDQLCDMGHAQSCHHVAIRLWNGDGIEADRPRAAALLQRACRAGYGVSCDYAARMATETGGTPDEVMDLAETGCHLGYLDACRLGAEIAGLDEAGWTQVVTQLCARGRVDACQTLHAAVIVEGGPRVPEGVTWDMLQAALGASCTHLVPASCEVHGMLHQMGAYPDSQRVAAISAFERACRFGRAESCPVAATMMRLMGADDASIEGILVVGCDRLQALSSCVPLQVHRLRTGTDVYYAAGMLQGMCVEGAGSACYWAAIAARDGLGVADDARASAEELAARGCALGAEDACSLEIALRMGDASRMEATRALAVERCDAGMTMVCHDVAEILAREGDADGSYAMSERACEGGYALACRRMFAAAAESERWTDALHFAGRLCGVEAPEYCLALGELTSSPRFGVQSWPTALDAFATACAGGSADGCVFAARTIELGAATSELPAIYYRALACRLGHAESCGN